jgi:hypothetical protein
MAVFVTTIFGVISITVMSMGRSCQGFLLASSSSWPTIGSSSRHHVQKRRSMTLMSVPNDHMDEEYEAARQEFENLMRMQQQLLDNSDTTTQHASIVRDSTLPPRDHHLHHNTIKPLTAASKRHKELEICFLEELVDSDDVVDPLVDLWVAERADGAEELRCMERTCSPGLRKEEQQLRQMISRYGTDWVEPMSRLAVILFTKGSYAHLEEAKDLCLIVLDVKPWHFEAAHLLVVILLRQGGFQQAVRITRKHCLPPLNDRTGHKRRRRWVDRYLVLSRQLFQRAQTATIIALQDDPVEDLCTLSEAEEDFCWQ